MEESKDNKMTENQPPIPQNTQPNETQGLHIQGHIKIFDPQTQEVYVDKRNAIHYENFSIGLAQAMSNQGKGFIGEMCFGNGGSRIDPTGIITYLTPNAVGLNASLYNQTYIKNIDSSSSLNLDPARNFMEIRHVTGTAYSDILVSCLLDFGEPSGQQAFDTSTSNKTDFVFDEIGLRGYSNDGVGAGLLLTHVIFHPVQKSLNRLLQVDYTVRIQSLTNGA
jgi:hypothetical protein